MMAIERIILLGLTASAIFIAFWLLIANSPSSSLSTLMYDIPEQSNSIRKLNYKNDNFATYTFRYKVPYTPEDTIGNTSFRIFDKATHVKGKFNLKTDVMPSKTKDTLDFMIGGFPKCGKFITKNG